MFFFFFFFFFLWQIIQLGSCRFILLENKTWNVTMLLSNPRCLLELGMC